MPTVINNENLGLKIGLIFSLISFLLTFTFLIPIFSVLPGTFIELIASNFVNNEPYSNVGKLTILIFSLILMIFLLITFNRIKNIAQKSLTLKKPELTLIMIIFYFIIHPLCFYIYWALFLNFIGDGQLIFGAVTSFPYSSIAFLVLGVLIDFIWKKEYNRTENKLIEK